MINNIEIDEYYRTVLGDELRELRNSADFRMIADVVAGKSTPASTVFEQSQILFIHIYELTDEMFKMMIHECGDLYLIRKDCTEKRVIEALHSVHDANDEIYNYDVVNSCIYDYANNYSITPAVMEAMCNLELTGNIFVNAEISDECKSIFKISRLQEV